MFCCDDTSPASGDRSGRSSCVDCSLLDSPPESPSYSMYASLSSLYLEVEGRDLSRVNMFFFTTSGLRLDLTRRSRRVAPRMLRPPLGKVWLCRSHRISALCYSMPSAVSGCGCEESVVLLRELVEVGSGVPFRDLVARSSRQQRLLWDWERVTVLAFASGGSRGARPALPLAVSAAARHGRGLVRMFLSQPDLLHLVLLVPHLSPFRPSAAARPWLSWCAPCLSRGSGRFYPPQSASHAR